MALRTIPRVSNNYIYNIKEGDSGSTVVTVLCYSASNRNEYQEYFLGVKAAGA